MDLPVRQAHGKQNKAPAPSLPRLIQAGRVEGRALWRSYSDIADFGRPEQTLLLLAIPELGIDFHPREYQREPIAVRRHHLFEWQARYLKPCWLDHLLCWHQAPSPVTDEEHMAFVDEGFPAPTLVVEVYVSHLQRRAVRGDEP